MSKDRRFVKLYKQGVSGTTVLLDKETGVQYLFYADGYAGGLTPLLDAQGNVVITAVHHNPKGPEF